MERRKHLDMKRLTLNTIVSETKQVCSRDERAKALVSVNSKVVWDYKIVDGKVVLISEPYPGLEEKDFVTFGELSKYVDQENPDCRDAEIVSESTSEVLQEYELLEAEGQQLVINLK